MYNESKSKDELLDELQSLKNENEELKALLEKAIPSMKDKYQALSPDFVADTADKRMSEEALSIERQRLSWILEGTNAGTWEWNIQTGETVFNERWAEIIGYKLDELTPINIETWQKYAHPDDLKVSGELLEKHFLGNLDYYEFESRMKHKNGDWVWVLDRGKVNKWDEEGKPLIMSGTHQDITKRRLAEDKLRISEARMVEILENSIDAPYKRNLLTNKYDYVGPSIVNIIGYTVDEYVQFSLNDVLAMIHPDDVANLNESLALMLANESKISNNVEYRLKHKDGKYRWIHDQFNIIRSADGTPLSLIGSVSDITEQKKAEKIIIENKFKLELALQTAKMAWWEMDVVTGLVTFEKSKAEMLGYSPDLFKHYKDFTNLVHPDDYENAMTAMRNHIIGKTKNYDIEYRIRTHTGEYKWFHDIGSIVKRDSDGKPLNVNGIVVDITERKLAEEEMRQVHHNYEIFFNTIDDLLFVLDEQGNIIKLNSTVVQRLGYNASELIGKSVLNVHPVDRREEAGRIVGEMLAGKADFCPVPVLTKSGVSIPVETRVSHGIWDGKPAIFGVTKDISQLRLSEEKFSKLFTINPSACGLSDLVDHKYIEVNEAFYNLLGFDENEVIGSTAYDLGILTKEATNNIMSHADSKGNVANVETELRAKNGEIKHVTVSSENIYVQDKQYRFTVVNDITKRKLAEEKLRENEEYLKLIYTIIGTGIMLVNSEDQTIIDINRAGSELIGLSPNEIIGKVCHEFICHDKVGQCTIQKMRLKVENVEKVLRTANGELKNIIKSVYPIQYNGINCYIESFTDISELKQKEAELKQINEDLFENKHLLEDNLYNINLLVEELSNTKEKLEKINSEKDKFFSIIAHDLKSPFNGFLGLTKIMAEDIDDLTLLEVKEFSQSMQKSADNLYKLLENLLEWSRMQRGLIQFDSENVSLSYVVRQILDVQSEVARQKDIAFINEIPQDLTVEADVPMLNTIFRNLISNALKFTPRGGTIEIGAVVKSAKGLKPSVSYVEVHVKDSGIGMNEETINKLFHIDQKVSRLGTENESSTGLGLLLCKEFVEKNGGKIWVESEEGIGSTFYFTLPNSEIIDN